MAKQRTSKVANEKAGLNIPLAKKCLVHILDTEGRSFTEWLDENGSEHLSATEISLLEECTVDGNQEGDKKLIAAFRKAAKYHIYATAWMAQNG